MNTLIKFILVIVVLAFAGCNKSAVDTPDEDYESLFGKKEIPKPTYDNILMPKLPCEPQITKAEYIYPGKDIANDITYKVTLKFWFKETRTSANENITTTQSNVDLRFVNADKELEILTTLHDKDLKNDKTFVKTFTVKSGFPLYLGIFGAGFDSFNMRASIQAVSDDGLVVTPEIIYEQDLYTDGYSDNFNYCEKIILP